MTTVLSVRCQQCGAPLQISEGLRFVTCTYCHAELEVIRDASTVHTEVLAKIEAKTDAMAGSLKVIEIQNEIERLDREWAMWREKNLDRDATGTLVAPTPPCKPSTVFRRSLASALMVETVALLLVFVLPDKTAMVWVLALVVGLASFALSFWLNTFQDRWAKVYGGLFAHHETQRSALVQKLASAQDNG